MNDVHSLEQFGNLALSFVIGFYFHVWFGVRLYSGDRGTRWFAFLVQRLE